MRLKGKIVLITGASAGIGAATALAFAAEGARLLLAARRAGKLAQVASRALEHGAAAVHSIDLDVRNRHAVQRAIDELPEEWAEIDILVNNAGLSRGLEKLYTGRAEDWEEMIDTNIKGLLYVTRRGLLRHQGRGPDHQRWAARGPAGHAGAGNEHRTWNGGNRLQPGSLPRRHEKGRQSLQGTYAADG